MNRMNLSVRVLLCALSVVMVCLCMSSCKHKMELQNNGAEYVDSKTNITYLYAGLDIQPVSTGDAYASLDAGGEKIVLYEIEGLDPEEWLATEDGDVFYANDVQCPSLALFDPQTMRITYQSTKEVELGTVEDATTCFYLVDEFLTGAAVTYLPTAADIRYDLYLTSEKYPGLQYHLLYLRFSEPIECGVDAEGNTITGSTFLFSRETHQYIVLPINILSEYVD